MDEPIVVQPEVIGEVSDELLIESRSGFGTVALPKYDPESFTQSDRVKIPVSSGYIDTDDLVYKAAVDLARGRTPMLWGPAGVGKTLLARHLAYLMCLPYERVPLGETSEREDVTGHYELKGSETKWVQSRLARAFTRPGVVCVDEWNAAPPAVLHVARPILDDSKQLALDAWDGRILQQHPHCFMLATGNPDWMPQYAGIMPLSEADSDRLSHINVTWPRLETEAEIILNHARAKDLDKVTAWSANLALRVWHEIRGAVTLDKVSVSAGTRSLVNFVECLQYHEPKQAMRKVYERMDPTAYGEIAGFLDHHDWNLYSNPMLVDADIGVLTSPITSNPDEPGPCECDPDETSCEECCE